MQQLDERLASLDKLRKADSRIARKIIFGRLPLISPIIRFMVRLFYLGRIWNAQSLVYQSMLEKLTQLEIESAKASRESEQ